MEKNAIDNKTLENLVKCAICLDYYIDPRCLPCSHTYCSECLVKLCAEGMGQCPMRDNTIIFRHTIDQLPVNRIAKELLECLNKQNKSEFKCEFCQEILSEFFCETCSKHFCTICLKSEHNLNQFKSHQINFLIKNENENENKFCLEHNEEKVKYWCNQCQQLVCSDCLLFKHKEHPFVFIQNLEENLRKDFNLSIENLNQMKINLQKLNQQTNINYQNHYKTHQQTIQSIENIFNNLQEILEKRKKCLIKSIREKDCEEQEKILEFKSDIEQQIKTIFIRILFLKQILNLNDQVKLIQLKQEIANYNQLIEQNYQFIIQGFTTDFQYFHIDQQFRDIQRLFDNFGSISTQTYLINQQQIKQLINLTSFDQEEFAKEFEENYAYGYRFDLNKSLTIYSIRIKLNLNNNHLIIFILDNNDFIIHKQFFNKTCQENSRLNWISIPINCLLHQNYYLFIYSSSSINQKKSLFAYQNSNQNLRKINENLSVRAKRALIDDLDHLQINQKLNVIYDALLYDQDDQQEQQEKFIPAIQIILDT